MHNTLRLVVALGLVVGGVLASPVPAATPVQLEPRQTTTTCARGIHIMVAGGCKVPCPSDAPDILSTLIADIMRYYPGSDEYLVPYNGSVTQGKDASVVMSQAVTTYAAACPSTKIVMLGYSLGGIVVLNTLCGGISPNLTSNIVAAITYGEETFRPGLSFDKGTCTMNAPQFPRNNTDLCNPYAPAIRDYCDSDDGKCCTGGTSAAAHAAYAKRYDFAAFNFIEQRYPGGIFLK